MSAIDEAAEEVEVVDGEVVPETAIVPYSGEVLDLRDASDNQLAKALDEARQFEREQLRGFKRGVEQVVLDRMDANAEWTVHTEEYTLSGDSPGLIDYDVDELRKALARLVSEGKLSEESASKAITAKTEYTASKRGIGQLVKLGGDVAEAIRACERPRERRSVRLKLRREER